MAKIVPDVFAVIGVVIVCRLLLPVVAVPWNRLVRKVMDRWFAWRFEHRRSGKVMRVLDQIVCLVSLSTWLSYIGSILITSYLLIRWEGPMQRIVLDAFAMIGIGIACWLVTSPLVAPWNRLVNVWLKRWFLFDLDRRRARATAGLKGQGIVLSMLHMAIQLACGGNLILLIGLVAAVSYLLFLF